MTKKLLSISLLIILTISLFSIIWFCKSLHYNFRTVIKNKVYRSAELPTKVLKEVVEKYHIKTIINLRNSHPEEQWWRSETLLAKTHHLTFYNVSIPAHGLPSKQQLMILTSIIAHSPRPVLIHCRHGSDRTGLASALVLILRNQKSFRLMYNQVSWRYLALSSDSVGKLVLQEYYKWLICLGKKPSKENYYLWLGLNNPFATTKFCKLSNND